MTQYSVLRLLAAGFVDYLGAGLFLAFSAVYFTQSVGLTAGQVGLGLGVAGCLALVLATPLGRVADRVGVRRTLVVLHLVRAVGTASYVMVGEWWGFLAAVTAVTVADQAIAALTQAFVAELADGERRGKVLAAYRTIANLGISVGGPLGGLITAQDGAFQLVLLANAGAYVLVALVLATIPQPPVRRERAARGTAAVRDRRLLALASLDTVLQLWLPVLNLGFPLWLAGGGHIPRAWIGPLYAVDTVLCVLLQLPAARLVGTVAAARRGQVAGGVLLSVSCLVFWAAPYAAQAAVALFTLAVVLLALGELLTVPAAWTLSYAIAPDDRRAEYLAAFGMGRSFGRYVLGPVLVTALLQSAGGLAWAVLAALFALAAAATPLAARHVATASEQVRS
ncbi:MFS transporter [Nonomuraea sp. NPDC000554]|uniref:MFS transporter n=1 Tax=Nonomuraea sp. NPDC000554 TaxID=3154259 RepID=UPI003329B653